MSRFLFVLSAKAVTCFLLFAIMTMDFTNGEEAESSRSAAEHHRFGNIGLANAAILVVFALDWYEFQLNKSWIIAGLHILMVLLAMNSMWTNYYIVASEPTVIGMLSWAALGVAVHFAFAAIFMGIFDLVRLLCRVIRRRAACCVRKGRSSSTDSEKGCEVDQPFVARSVESEGKLRNNRRSLRIGRAKLDVDTVKVLLGYLYVLILSVQGFYVAFSEPQVIKVTVKFHHDVDGLPPDFDNFRIVELADLHLGPTVGASRLARVVEQVNQLNPDLVVIVGDLVDSRVSRLKGALEPLRNLRVPAYYVTGNHEFYYDGVDQWLQALRSVGVHTLVNEAVMITAGKQNRSSLCLCGMDDLQANKIDYPGHRANFSASLADCAPDSPIVLLMHQPKGAQFLLEDSVQHDHLVSEYGMAALPLSERRRRVKLVLSGHTHAGQLAPFSYAAIFAVRLTNYQFFNGLYERTYAGLPNSTKESEVRPLPRTYVYVSAGTFFGCLPMRTASIMEITEVTLRVTR